MNYQIRQAARKHGIPPKNLTARVCERIERYHENEYTALERSIQNLTNDFGLTDAELKADGGDKKFYKPVQLREVA